ncbi:phage holin family protein [Corynebacterium otitidis]|uniref:Phage holin family protein n=1 Tax=Corynebacterium otitidis ATCC 51513 TaxID=883169 RepID=I7IXR8_9CORY|nr:phage holin family protein [Corynebacterium otitidis]EJZ81309.1 hypothetical protein HMPREF9719_01717 [Corynebacterium otitidis ATCC 51513]CCI84023.1 hypothetical protein BN46_1301 [Corynebacterium otitidis ATCC 51513]
MGCLWNLLVRSAGTAVALWAATALIDGLAVATPIEPLVGDGGYDRLIVFLASAGIIVLVNMTVRPVLHLLGLPLTILTLGIFALVINAIALLFAGAVANAVGLGLYIDGFGAAFLGAIILGLVNWLLGPLVGALSAPR